MAFKPPKNKKPTGTTQTLPSATRYNAVNYAAPAPSPVAQAPAPTFGSAGTHDSAYDAMVALAARNRDNEIAAAAGDSDLLRRTYGYAGENDFTLDPTNPYSRAMALKVQYDRSKAGTTSSYSARGQQTSGAYVRMQNNNLDRYQQGSDALQKDYLAGRAQILARINAANSQYGSDAINAGLGGLDRALAARDVYQTNAPAAPAQSQAAKSAAAHGGPPKTEYRNGKTIHRYPDGYVAVF
jgi:hypothetical protein